MTGWSTIACANTGGGDLGPGPSRLCRRGVRPVRVPPLDDPRDGQIG